MKRNIIGSIPRFPVILVLIAWNRWYCLPEIKFIFIQKAQALPEIKIMVRKHRFAINQTHLH